MKWKTVTLRDHLESIPPSERRRRVVQESGVGNHSVRCGICPRVTAADMMLDVRSLPATMRAALDLEAGDDFVCDGCRERWFREGKASRVAFFAALGAPAATLARIQQFARDNGEPS